MHHLVAFQRTPLAPLALALAGSLLLAPRADAQCDPEVLLPNVPQPSQGYGSEVAVSGSQIFGSAPRQDLPQQLQGGVIFVHQWDPNLGLYVPSQTLGAPSTSTATHFGQSFSVENGLLAVGAPGRPNVRVGGEVFVFELDAATGRWEILQTLTRPNPRAFGNKVVLAGDYLFVTEAYRFTGSAGSLLIYRRASSGQFQLLQVVNSPEIVDGNEFPTAIELTDTGLLALGDPLATVGGVQAAGHVRLMELNPSTGLFQAAGELSSADPNPNGMFGATLAWNGQDLLVSEHGDDMGVPNPGDARVYREAPGGGLGFYETISLPQTEFAAGFGRVLACDGDTALLESNPLASSLGNNIALYRRDPQLDSWRFVQRYGPGGFSQNGLGRAAGDIEGATVAMGSPIIGFMSGTQGRVLVQRDGRNCATTGTKYCAAATANSTGQVGELNAIGEVALAQSSTLDLFGYDLPPNVLVLPLVALEPGFEVRPGAAGPVCLGGPMGRFYGQAGLSAPNGAFSLVVNLNQVPSPSGPFPVEASDALHFQLWHRDVTGATFSQFTRAIRVVFETF